MGVEKFNRPFLNDSLPQPNWVGQGLLLQLAAGQNATLVVLSDSTGDATTEWPYLIALDLSKKFPKARVEFATWASSSATDYPAVTVVQAGSGSDGTLSFWNCSVSSQASQFFLAPYANEMWAAKSPDLVFVSLGHNEGSAAAEPFWRDNLPALTETVTAACPMAELVLLTQNPRTDGNAAVQAARRHITARIARMRGYGLIDTYRVFVKRDGTTNSALIEDTIHPNALGQQAMRDAIATRLTYVPGASTPGQQESSLLRPIGVQGLLNADFALFASPPTLDNWTATQCTLSKTTTAEDGPNGWAVRLQSASAATSYMEQGITGDALRQYLGQWVTFAARMYIPAGSISNVGRIHIRTTGGSNTISLNSTATTQGQGGWKWVTLSGRVDPTATTLTCRVYAENGATGVGDCYCERVVLSKGLLPRDLR